MSLPDHAHSATAKSDPEIHNDHELIRQIARSECYDWYLAALLAPRQARSDLITLTAFAGELDRIPRSVSEPMMGAIRLQWWRDALAAPQHAQTGNPLADAVRALANRQILPAAHLTAMIDAQEVELQTDPPEDDQALANHFNKQWGGLISLWGHVLADRGEVLPAQLAFDAGTAYGLARLSLDLALGLRRGQILVPTSRLKWADLTAEVLITQPNSEAARALRNDLAIEARRALAACRSNQTKHSRNLRPALFPLTIVEPYLRGSQGRPRAPSEFKKSCRMLAAWMRGGI